jgi:hypothetical protein
MTISVREQLIHTLDRLTDEQVEALLGVARVMQPAQKPPYDPEKDGTVAIYSGPAEEAEQIEDILDEAVKQRGGWTLKDPE